MARPRKKERQRARERAAAASPAAAQAGPSGVGALPRWAAALALAGLVAGTSALGFKHVTTNDIGFHVRIGATIWETMRPPGEDHYSFTADGAEYLDHEWVPQLLFYWTDRLAGPAGLVALAGAAVIAAFLLVGWTMRRTFLAAALALVACGVVAHSRVEVRPHVLSWVLIGALLVAQQGGRRLAVALLLALWGNCHASFMLAVLMTLIWAAQQYFAGRDRKWLLWAGAFVAAPCLNPYGPTIYAYAFRIKEHIGFVSEWQRFPATSGYLWVIVLVLALLLVDILRRPGGRPWDGMRLLLLGGLSFSAMRHGVDAMLYLAPVVAARYGPLLGRLGARGSAAVALSAALAGAGGCAWLVARGEAYRFRVDHTALPVAATGFVMRHALAGNMFNDYNFGGYLLWKAWPRHRVFVDGRLEVYERGSTLDDYLRASRGEPGWEEVLRRHDVAFAVVRADREIAHALSGSAEWGLAYFDYNAAVFVRRGTHPGLRRLQLLTPWGNRDGLRVAESIGEARYLLAQNPLFFGGYKILAFLLYRAGDLPGARDALARYLELRPQGKKLAETRRLVDALREKGF